MTATSSIKKIGESTTASPRRVQDLRLDKPERCPLEGMARDSIDPIDVAALVLVPIAGATSLGVWSLEVDVFGGYDLSEPLWTSGGAMITIPVLITVLGILWILGTNELDGSDYSDYESTAILGVLAVVPAYALIPPVQEVVDSSDTLKLVLALTLAAATVLISYTE
jgi:hypothetical protein